MGSRHFWIEDRIVDGPTDEDFRPLTVSRAGRERLRAWLDKRVVEVTASMLDAFMGEIERNAVDGYEPQCELPGHMNDLRPTCPEVFYLPIEFME